MTVMVCAPNVNNPVKAALYKLVSVVCDIRGKVRGEAVCADQNLVFAVLIRVFKPQRTVFFIAAAAVL